MGATTTPTAEQGKTLVDAIINQQQVLAAAQAKYASLMLEFSDTRRRLDQQRITTLHADGTDPRYTPGEFAALEIGLAIKAGKHTVSRTIGIARRLSAETPDAWDAWQAGHIDHDRAARINRALRRLTQDSSKQLLNVLVVDVAVCKTPELLSRWLNEFIARVEPDQTNDRLRRSLEDRYVSIRPDIDGISFLTAAIAAADADAINQVLDALAAIALPGDTRTFQQRRADACTELLLGKISNGCHVSWQNDPDNDDNDNDDNDNGNDQFDDNHGAEGSGDGPIDHTAPDDPTEDGCDCSASPPADDPDTHANADAVPNADADAVPNADAEWGADADAGAKRDAGADAERDTGADAEWDENAEANADADADISEPGGPHSTPTGTGANPADRPWDTDDDWDLPASAFRPDPHAEAETTSKSPPDGSPPNPNRNGRPVITPCPHNHHTKPIPATIGVIITAQSLLGYTNTPGQLTDRSSLVPADLIRDLARQPGTLFHRLLTDEKGNLLDVTELGRFPSRKLGIAINYRDGTCTTPICTTPAHKCDHDHVIPVPEGPTTAINLNNHCRPEHRAKTHAGHHTSRDGNTTTWTTPTGHTYTTTDQPFPAEQWPTDARTDSE